MKEQIGPRIKEIREERNVSQEKLAQAVGWKHHQIVGQVEKGDREVKAWELFAIAKFLHVAVDVILGKPATEAQPYVLWRQKPLQEEKLLEAKFLAQCESYSWIEQVVSIDSNSTYISEELPRINIDLKTYTLEMAYQLAQSARESIGLGDFPANQLVSILEGRYGVRFIVDDEIDPPAACSRMSKGCFILINGKNAEVRQYFSIAHELFHLMTWNEEMLKQIEVDERLHKHNERLANAFAAGLLIPKEKLQQELIRICPKDTVDMPEVIALAEQFQVSLEAMLYRLHNSKLLTESKLKEMKERIPTLTLPKATRQAIAHMLKSKFVRLVYLAYEHTKITRAKAARLLNTDLSELSDLFNDYGFIETNT